jgi:hypothetical protein
MLREIYFLTVIVNGVLGVSWVFNKMNRDENSRIVGGKEVEIVEAPVSYLIYVRECRVKSQHFDSS